MPPKEIRYGQNTQTTFESSSRPEDAFSNENTGSKKHTSDFESNVDLNTVYQIICKFYCLQYLLILSITPFFRRFRTEMCRIINQGQRQSLKEAFVVFKINFRQKFHGIRTEINVKCIFSKKYIDKSYF